MILLVASIAYLSGLSIYILKELYKEHTNKESLLEQVMKVNECDLNLL